MVLNIVTKINFMNKITKIGGSYAILIPNNIVKIYDLNQNDLLEVNIVRLSK